MLLESIPVIGLSYLLIALGIVFLASGYYLRRKGSEYSDYILAAGGIMLAAAIVLIGYFISSFG